MGSKPKSSGSSGATSAAAQQAAATETANRAQQATLANQIGGAVAPTGATPSTGGLVIPTQAPGMMMGAGLNYVAPAATPTRSALASSIAAAQPTSKGYNPTRNQRGVGGNNR